LQDGQKWWVISEIQLDRKHSETIKNISTNKLLLTPKQQTSKEDTQELTGFQRPWQLPVKIHCDMEVFQFFLTVLLVSPN